MQPHYTNGSTAPQSIFTNIPARLDNFLSSYSLLTKKNHPAPGNKVWILHNMARTHSETHYKVSPRIRDHGQRSHVPEEATTRAAASANVTPLFTKAGENTSEVLLQLSDLTEKYYSDLTGKFPVQPDRRYNYILVAYNYDANIILTIPLYNRTGPCIING